MTHIKNHHFKNSICLLVGIVIIFQFRFFIWGSARVICPVRNKMDIYPPIILTVIAIPWPDNDPFFVLVSDDSVAYVHLFIFSGDFEFISGGSRDIQFVTFVTPEYFTLIG